MQVSVSNHAVSQYRRKMIDYSTSEENIIDLLSNISLRGKKIHSRPGACEIKHRGMSVVVRYENDTAVVITFLGDEVYCKWYRKKEKTYRKKAS